MLMGARRLVTEKDLFGQSWTQVVGAKPEKRKENQPSLWDHLVNPRVTKIPAKTNKHEVENGR